MENVTSDLKDSNEYIQFNRRLCYQHSGVDAPQTTMEVFCDEPSVGNQIRLELANRTSQLVLCDLRIYGGKCIIICLTLSSLQTNTRTCVNSADPDEMPRNEPSHQYLHCLQSWY